MPTKRKSHGADRGFRSSSSKDRIDKPLDGSDTNDDENDSIDQAVSHHKKKKTSNPISSGEITTVTSKKNERDSFDVSLPSSILKGSGISTDNQCTLLVEVSDSKDSISLGEFGGSIGAIGRFESDTEGITLDLKGNQYRGSLLPGPTCLIVGFPQSFGIRKKELPEGATTLEVRGEDNQGNTVVDNLRVEGVVDEYTTIVQIDDHMKKLDAVVIGDNE